MTPEEARPDPGFPSLGLAEAARRVGLHYMTLYRHVRTGRLPAVQRAGRWWVAPSDLERLVRAPRPARTGPTRWEPARRRLLERMSAGDQGGAAQVVEESLAGGASAADIHLRLLGPVLEEVGRQWAAGAMTVQAEHRVTAVALRLAGRLSPHFSGRGTPTAGTVVLGGAPGDHHLLPVWMAADLMRSRRVRIVDLGADVPVASFLEAAETAEDLRAVGVSLSDRGRWGAAAQVLREVRGAFPGVLLLGGGPAVGNRAAALELGADDWAPNGLAAAELVARWARR